MYEDKRDTPEERVYPEGVSRRSLIIASGLALGVAAFGVEDSVSPSAASAAGTYLRPCGNVPISDSWQGHKNRNPPSQEPGTDYSVAAGTPVRAATNGMIVDRKDSTSGATGRYLALRGDDGNYIRYLHLKSSAISPGHRVARGQVIAQSGASGFGSDNGYGAHVHVSLWIGGTPFQIGFRNSVDFERYVGDPPTTPQPPQKKDVVMRTIYNVDGVDSDVFELRRRATVGEFSFQPLSFGAATLEFALWGAPENVTQSQWNSIKAIVNSRRIANGMPALP
ncbi:M23 family metallopeptidase [Microbacterium paraoxydans]|uniref:M23 family metallopeptidase n=1 Tax=Microbacterium paraoxydans TaxID=199592 RepID=UPI001CF9E14A|nr:M23 family metallopeptidase [Microbacterium paraoxydans]